MCERTIAKYEEKLWPTKEEKERQHQLLDVYYKKHHQVVLHRTDVCEEQLLPEKQECSLRMVKEDPSKRKTRCHEPSGVFFSSLTQTLSCKKKEEDSLTHHVKKEEGEHSISQEHIEGLVSL
ncbi:uncharacterized protein LOC133545407 isoform X5 [Nerophis ophidion]|uniref:uncharacterized protein LOC133545407 isoform X5 n=1 Tax=Nerophis ophidion TaxID=159077 RepID=UPI002AE05F6E|nr:uncharacterized protein LOC133545407 isoform X5 [Nerophis ophidion]